tara:strand:+ start:369 stop:566 length:198 start_codon:yes stop_codon:yes gene_type:complete
MNICDEIIQTSKVNPYEILSIIIILFLKLCCINKIIGIAIKPAKDTAFAIEEISFKIRFVGLRKY